jgi:serine/threonine-protein kinase
MLVGQQFGPFTIDKELGSGAMGTVYRGRFSKTGQVMAIKVMSASVSSTNAAAVDRFEREIVILKQLNHPNIVRFYGAGKQQKLRYFAMEYVEGESLDHIMSRRGRMTWEEVVALGQQLCAALQHAHEQGIIHRDLKPSNIMVLRDGTLKLTDFGIAKATELEALTATNCTVGTAAYMSPEQCKGETDITHKSDLYSLGVLFYELLTGRKPFTAITAMEMFLAHVNGEFERPSRKVLDIPVWLDTLVCQLLEKMPEKRPLDAHLVSNTLGTIQEKVEAQQSAGVEAVRRRMIDRLPGQKKPDEEDKDAARTLMTGKGRAKRKQIKKRLHQKIWFQATGLMLGLGIVGTLLYLVFKPPSAEKLYQQAEKLMTSANVEDHDKAQTGPIEKYLNRYGSQDDELTRKVRAWSDRNQIRYAEDKLLKLRQMRRKNLPFAPMEGEGEEKPFAAAEAEDAGDLTKAREKWQEVEKDKALPRRWLLVATNHLLMLDEIFKQDSVFAEVHDKMRETREEPELDPIHKKAFLAWRAEQLGDKRLARKRFQTLRDELANEPTQSAWSLYANWKNKGLEPQEKEAAVEAVTTNFKKAKNDIVICMDILALYEKEKDDSLQDLVEEARNILDKGASKRDGKRSP